MTDDRGAIEVRSPSRQTVSLALSDPLFGSEFLEYRLHERLGFVVFLNWGGKTVHRLDLNSPTVQPIASLHRSGDDDPGLYRVRLYELGDDTLVSYEGGLLRVSPSGDVLWHVAHPFQVDWDFVGLENNIAWYVSEREGRWGYRLDDGAEVDFREA